MTGCVRVHGAIEPIEADIARSLHSCGRCNGWLGPETVLAAFCSGSTAI